MKKVENHTKTPIDVEVIPEQESAWLEKIADITVKLQEKRKSLQDGKILRGVHPKSHGCIDADFIVNKDIRGDYRVGLFAQPGKRYKAKIRYSNAEVLVRPDLENRNSKTAAGAWPSRCSMWATLSCSMMAARGTRIF